MNSSMNEAIKVIIDTDPGVDDAFALYYASRCSALHILGITTTYGNNYVAQTTRNACFLKEQFALPGEIYKGCSRPLVNGLLAAGNVHGSNGLGDAFEVKTHISPSQHSAVDFIINTVKKYPGEITLVTLGPLTNLATAINQAPEIIPLIRQVVMMGGAFGHHGHRGNVTPVAEFNIYCDPHAADIVFQQPIPVVIVGLDVTHEVIIFETDLHEINKHPHIALLQQIAAYYFNFSHKYENIKGMRVHDALTIGWLMQPEAFGIIQAPVRVACEGVAAGETIYQMTVQDRQINDWNHQIRHKICVEVDAEKIRQHFLQTISSQH